MKQGYNNPKTGQNSNLLTSTALGTVGTIMIDGCKTVANGIGYVFSGIAMVARGLAKGLSYEEMSKRDYMIGN